MQSRCHAAQRAGARHILITHDVNSAYRLIGHAVNVPALPHSGAGEKSFGSSLVQNEAFIGTRELCCAARS
jgi:hypothetical protein